MKSKFQILILTIVICNVVLSAVYIFIDVRQQNKIAYIRITDVYNEFKMKKDYEVLYSKTENLRQQIVDSLNLEFNKLRRSSKLEEALQNSYQNLVNTKKEFDESNQLLKEKYNAEIFTRINQYVLDYSKQHNYDLILGADGRGSIMASDDGLDITEDIIKFINEEYSGDVRNTK